jgi:hypothetical protein
MSANTFYGLILPQLLTTDIDGKNAISWHEIKTFNHVIHLAGDLNYLQTKQKSSASLKEHKLVELQFDETGIEYFEVTQVDDAGFGMGARTVGLFRHFSDALKASDEQEFHIEAVKSHPKVTVFDSLDEWQKEVNRNTPKERVPNFTVYQDYNWGVQHPVDDFINRLKIV